VIRGITGYGAGNGPFSIHDGFRDTAWWTGFLPGSDRIILDTPPYCVNGAPNDSPIATITDPLGGGRDMAEAGLEFLWVVVEYELERVRGGHNDCELYLTVVNGTHHYAETAACCRTRAHGPKPPKLARSSFALASMDTTSDWFFSMRKIGPALDGVMHSPLWSYQFGLQTGFMPIDLRDSVGVCRSSAS